MRITTPSSRQRSVAPFESESSIGYGVLGCCMKGTNTSLGKATPRARSAIPRGAACFRSACYRHPSSPRRCCRQLQANSKRQSNLKTWVNEHGKTNKLTRDFILQKISHNNGFVLHFHTKRNLFGNKISQHKKNGSHSISTQKTKFLFKTHSRKIHKQKSSKAAENMNYKQ